MSHTHTPQAHNCLQSRTTKSIQKEENKAFSLCGVVIPFHWAPSIDFTHFSFWLPRGIDTSPCFHTYAKTTKQHHHPTLCVYIYMLHTPWPGFHTILRGIDTSSCFHTYAKTTKQTSPSNTMHIYTCYTLHGLVFTPFCVELTQALVFTPMQRNQPTYMWLAIAPGPTVHWLFWSQDLPSKYRSVHSSSVGHVLHV